MNSIENTENEVPSKTDEYNNRDNFLKILAKDHKTYIYKLLWEVLIERHILQ